MLATMFLDLPPVFPVVPCHKLAPTLLVQRVLLQQHPLCGQTRIILLLEHSTKPLVVITGGSAERQPVMMCHQARILAALIQPQWMEQAELASGCSFRLEVQDNCIVMQLLHKPTKQQIQHLLSWLAQQMDPRGQRWTQEQVYHGPQAKPRHFTCPRPHISSMGSRISE
jgi:hypothetical protein